MASNPTTPCWTQAQRSALEHGGGDLLVSAAAGSGKTAVLAERCARLVAEGHTTIDRLLVVTFTEAAANEMRTRIATALQQKIDATARAGAPGGSTLEGLRRQAAMVQHAHISTLHAFCMRTLRNYFHEAQLDPSFDILDEDEAKLLRDEVLQDVLARWHGLAAPDPKAAAFADFYEAYGQGQDATVAGFVRELYRMLSSVKDRAAWLAAARQVYAAEGVADTLARYVGLVKGELELLAARLTRYIAQAPGTAGGGSLIKPLQGLAEVVTQACDALQGGLPGWDRAAAIVRSYVEQKQPQVRTPPDGGEDFARLKKRCYESVRAQLRRLAQGNLAQRQTAAQLRQDLLAIAPALDTLLALTEDFTRSFTAAKRGRNRLDFSDLERCTLDLLTSNTASAAGELQKKFDFILVDEFQDINPLQAALLEAVRSPSKHGGRGNLFVVGDVKQSIYGFRLAEPKLFLDLQKRLAAVQTHRAVVMLANNFRSLPTLLEALNAIFERVLTPSVAGMDYNNGHALQPREVDAAARPPVNADGLTLFDGRPEFHLVLTGPPTEAEPAEDSAEADGEETASAAGPADKSQDVETLSAAEHEAAVVAERIAQLMSEHRGVVESGGTVRALRYRDMAILLRGLRSKAHIFTRALAQRGIPAHADLSTGYFDAPEIRDTLALLTILDNPLQDIPLAAALLSPFGRFSHDDLARIRLAFPDRHATPFHAAVFGYLTDGDDRELAARLAAFFATLERYRTRVRTVPLHEAIAEIYQDSGLLTYVSGLLAGPQRVANLQALHQRALQFAEFSRQGLYRFLRFIERFRDSEEGGDFGEAPVLSDAADVVRLMTVHKSKGLEFPVVFVCSLGTKFNVDNAGPIFVSRDEHVGLQVADVPRNVFLHSAASARIVQAAQRSARAEELRLLYVALTRPRQHLILTGALKPARHETLQQAAAEITPGQPLPEDVLLRGGSFLDWLVPVTAQGLGGKIVVTEHQAAEQAPAQTARAAENPWTAKIQQRQPLHAGGDHQAAVNALAQRLSYQYPAEALTTLPALYSVTELKKLHAAADPDEDQPAQFAQETLDTAPAEGLGSNLPEPRWAFDGAAQATPAASRVDPRQRGIATHRVLELLDFARVSDARALEACIAEVVDRHLLTKEQASVIQRDDILWFLQGELGRRLQALASEGGGAGQESGAWAQGATLFSAAPDRAALWRELPFSYALDAAEIPAAGDLLQRSELQLTVADQPILRGVIDLLLVAADGRSAELVDYKTDRAWMIPAALPAYRRQMYFYARAAEAILGLPRGGVTRATLVFLSARQTIAIDRPSAQGTVAG